MVFYCCVPNCNGQGYIKRVLPVWDMEAFRIWVHRIQNPKLTLDMDPKAARKRFLVCDKHFEDSCRIQGENRLKRDSLPTLDLPPGYHRSSEKDALLRFFKDYSAQALGESSVIEIDASIASTSDVAIEHADILPTSSHSPSGGRKKSCIAVPASKSKLLQGKARSSKLLSPDARVLYKKLRSMEYKLNKIKKSSAGGNKEKLSRASEICMLPEFLKVTRDNVVRKFIMSQLTELKKQPRGRRFSLDDKILALSILRQSRKGYNLLQKVFALPSRQTLNTLLKNIKFQPGINKHIFNHLKLCVSKMTEKDKYCSLMFDEMSISSAVQYDERSDSIIGFETDFDGKSTGNFADHVLLFMVKGIHRKWKQPIVFMFTEHATPAHRLKVLLKNIITELQSIGLKVLATVCDQGTNNVSAINLLLTETNETFIRQNLENRLLGFLVNDIEILPFFDPPHLLKGIRNNLLTKDVNFTINKIQYKASWSDIIRLYELDSKYEDKKLCIKLTDQHVYKEQIQKMKVSNAAQVFSQRVAAILNFAAECGKLPSSSHGTSEFILFMDKLFDSVNASSVMPCHGKNLRVAVQKSSHHMTFWNEAISILRTMKFLDVKGRQVVPPSVTNWIKTIKSFQYLSNKLLNSEFQFFCTRNINQDPVENFFGSIRSQGARNINPTPTNFISSFKTLLINNFLSSRSAATNCEEDESEGALDNLKSFLLLKPVVEDTPVIPNIIRDIPIEDYVESEELITKNLNTYLAGFIARKISNTLTCKDCKRLLKEQGNMEQPTTSLIMRRQYSRNSLCIPSTTFSKLFSISFYYCNAYMPKLINLIGLKRHLVNILIDKNNIKISCKLHPTSTVESIIKQIVHFFILAYIKCVNRILKGRYQRHVFVDPLKAKALDKYKKSYRHKKSH